MLHNIDTILKMLERSNLPHLADSFDLLPLDVQCGVSKMVEEMFMSDKHYKVIQQKVVEDVTKATDGVGIAMLECFNYIHQNNIIGTI